MPAISTRYGMNLLISFSSQVTGGGGLFRERLFDDFERAIPDTSKDANWDVYTSIVLAHLFVINGSTCDHPEQIPHQGCGFPANEPGSGWD